MTINIKKSSKWQSLEEKTGVKFTSSKLLKHAFIHRSYLNETREKLTSNERLEFLGDAVLEFLASEYLYISYPKLPEGMLTNIRSSIVKTESLANVAKELGFGKYLFVSRGEEDGGGRHNPSLLADVFEAFLGALFLDQGIKAADKFLKRFLFPKISEIVNKKTYIDFKSSLQEKVQEKCRISPTYRVIKEEGQDHAKTFWIEVLVDKKVLGRGKGKSKQEAEQQAAKQSLEKGIEI